jgi:hypothetical protein
MVAAVHLVEPGDPDIEIATATEQVAQPFRQALEGSCRYRARQTSGAPRLKRALAASSRLISPAKAARCASSQAITWDSRAVMRMLSQERRMRSAGAKPRSAAG